MFVKVKILSTGRIIAAVFINVSLIINIQEVDSTWPQFSRGIRASVQLTNGLNFYTLETHEEIFKQISYLKGEAV